jgi:hypothetical protein
VKQFMPGSTGHPKMDPWYPFDGLYVGSESCTDLGPTRIRVPTGRAAVSSVAVSTPFKGVLRLQKAYTESELQAIIEQGQSNPRPIPPELQERVEAARVAAKEDHRVLEMQFAGIGASGSYGSLDGRNRKRQGGQE